MCTIFTFTKDDYLGTDTSEFMPQAIEEQMIDDILNHNDDGYSVLLIDINGQPVTSLRSMDIEPVFRLLYSAEYHRAFVHLRAATSSYVGLDSTHGWHDQGYWWMHNGYIPSGNHLRVDSLQIGKWLSIDIDYCLDRMLEVDYCNTFIVDSNTGVYYVSRSFTNSLYTDGKGNYSTNAVGPCTIEVPTYSTHEHDLAEWYGYDYVEGDDYE